MNNTNHPLNEDLISKKEKKTTLLNPHPTPQKQTTDKTAMLQNCLAFFNQIHVVM